MSDRDPPAGQDDIFPRNWVVGTAAADLARKDDGVLVDPHVGQVLEAGPDGRPVSAVPTAPAAPPRTAEQAPAGPRREPYLDVAADAPSPGRAASVSNATVEDAEIAALWSETARLQHRFAATRSDGRAVGLPSTGHIESMPLEADRSARPRRRDGQPGRWFLAIVGSVLIAAAIVMAERAGLLDTPRDWLHRQFARQPAATDADVGREPPVFDIRREPVSRSD